MSFTPKPFEIKKSKIRDGLAYFLTIATVVLILLPIVVFVLLTFVEKYPVKMNFSMENILKAMDLGAAEYLINSLVIALFTALIGEMCIRDRCAHPADHRSAR